MSTLNNSLLEAMTNKIIEGFDNGKTVVVFKGNQTIVLSDKVHSEAVLMKYINVATAVRICA